MDIWHATVYASGKVYDEDRVGRDAAQQWVAQKLTELGYVGEIQWDCDGDLCQTNIRPDLTARVQRRS